MNIPFDPDSEQKFIAMQEEFNAMGEDAIAYSHYELARMSVSYPDPQDWKAFLFDARVSEFLTEEAELLRQIKYRRAINDLDTNSKSPGAAQVFNALSKAEEKKDEVATGPAVIYTYIPLSKEERAASNVKILHKDPFAVEVPDTPQEAKPIEDVGITKSNEFL